MEPSTYKKRLAEPAKRLSCPLLLGSLLLCYPTRPSLTQRAVSSFAVPTRRLSRPNGYELGYKHFPTLEKFSKEGASPQLVFHFFFYSLFGHFLVFGTAPATSGWSFRPVPVPDYYFTPSRCPSCPAAAHDRSHSDTSDGAMPPPLSHCVHSHVRSSASWDRSRGYTVMAL